MKTLYEILPGCIGSEETKFGLPLPPYFDELVPTGIPRGMITLLFSESGNFKTTIKANLVDHVLEKGYTVLDYSLEDQANLIGATRLSRITGIPYFRIMMGDVTPEERIRLDKACESSLPSKKHFTLEDSEMEFRSLRDIQAKCLAVKEQCGLDLLCIDYAQLLDFSHLKGDNADKKGLDELVKQLQAFSQQLDIAVILVSQISRDRLLSRKDKRPIMKDLYGSSYLEFGCKLAIACYRPWNYQDEQYEDFAGAHSVKTYESLLELWVRKNRFGRTNVCTRCVVELPTGQIEAFDGPIRDVTPADMEIGF